MRIDWIAGYGRRMKALSHLAEEDCRILWKEGKRCYATKAGANLAALTEGDIEDLTDWEITEKEVLMGLRGAEAMIVARPKYCLECIARRKPITASLDDMAQIIGYRAEIARYEEKPMAAALKRAAGVLVRASRRRDAQGNSEMPACAVTVGRDPYEAFVAMTVLEKAAEVSLKAEVLGGAKTMLRPLAAAERLVYRTKYSKAERKFEDEKDQ